MVRTNTALCDMLGYTHAELATRSAAEITHPEDVARELPLQEIGTRFDDEGKDLAPPSVFWEKFGK